MKCTYPSCDCPVAFPCGYKPSEATECPRSDSIPALLSPGEYSFNGGLTWFVGTLADAFKRMFPPSPNYPYDIGAGGDPGPHTIAEARFIAQAQARLMMRDTLPADEKTGLWYWLDDWGTTL